MDLSSDLISQFVKATKDDVKPSEGSTVNGTIVEHDGNKYVRLDGSDQLTPISSTADAKVNERVTVLIKNHTATVTGNLSSPAARTDDLKNAVGQISKFEIVLADKVDTEQLNAANAKIEQLQADDVVIRNTLTVYKADIDKLVAEDATINGKLTATEAKIDDLEATKIDADIVKAEYATIGRLEAVEGNFNSLESTYGEFVDLTTDNFEAINAEIDSLDATYATIEALDAEKARINYLEADMAVIDVLEADVADINTLIFGSASGTTIQTSFANAVIAQLGNAQIKSAMIESISADKITAGDIITNNVRVMSEDGKLLISDETIQISDDTRVRVQIGKDAAGDYSINIWDADGNLMFSEGGITDSAIKEAIIRDDMVSATANIQASKLDISSLFEEINGSEHTINSTKVYLDDKGQTLDIAFTSLTTDVGELGETVSSQGTAISTMQGQITSKIWNQDIETATSELEETTQTLSTQYSELNQEIDSMSTTIARHDTEISNKADGSAVTAVSKQLTDLEADLDGFKTTVIEEVSEVRTDLDNLEIGGRNLLLKTRDFLVTNNRWTGWINSSSFAIEEDDEGFCVASISASGLTEPDYKSCYSSVVNASTGDTFIISCWFMVDDISALDNQKVYIFETFTEDGNRVAWDDCSLDRALTSELESGKWVRLVSKHTVSYEGENLNCGLRLCLFQNGSIHFKKCKMEKGTVVSDWTPAPEDMVETTDLTYYAKKSELEQTAEQITLSVSETYTTKTEFSNLEIGGRNLLRNTKTFEEGNPTLISGKTLTENGYMGLTVFSYDNSASTNSADAIHFREIFHEKLGEEFTLSFYAKGSGRIRTYFYGPTGYLNCDKTVQSTGAVDDTANDGSSAWELTNEWTRYWVTWTMKTEGDISIEKYVLFRFAGGAVADICGCKLERGNKATSWTPAPEDMAATSDLESYAKKSELTQTAEDITLSVSETYTTKQEFNNLDIGSRNILLGTGTGEGWSQHTSFNEEEREFVKSSTSSGESYIYCDNPFDLEPGQQYTLSLKAKQNGNVKNAVSDVYVLPKTFNTTGIASHQRMSGLTTEYQDYAFTFVPNASATSLADCQLRFDNEGCATSGTEAILYIKDVKLEKGNKATDWSPAPEDYMTAKETRAAIKVEADEINLSVSSVRNDLDNLEIGGRNLVPNTTLDTVYSGNAGSGTYKDVWTEVTIGIPEGTEYIVSFDAKADEAQTIKCFFYNPNTTLTSESSTGQIRENVADGTSQVTITTEWKRYWVKWTQTPATARKAVIVGRSESTSNVYIRAVKLEEGNKPTSWTPAPEDYMTAAETETAIELASESITSTVSKTYATNTALSEVKQTADGVAVSLANNYTPKTLPDTRDTNQSPSWYIKYYPKQVITEFKQVSVIGLSGETYCALETTVPWSDSSGGYPKQVAKVGGKEYTRVGVSDSAWGAWQDASKTATNFMEYTSSGLDVGNKQSGSWSGYRTRMASSAFQILDASSNILASYEANAVYLAKNNKNATISFCNDAAKLYYNSSSDWMTLEADNLYLKAFYTSGNYEYQKRVQLSTTRLILGNDVYYNGSIVNASSGWFEIDRGDGVFETGTSILIQSPSITLYGDVGISGDIDNVSAITASGQIKAGSFSTTGAMSSGSVSTGSVSASSVSSTTTITASGKITGASFSTSGAMSSGSVSTGAISASSMSSTGSVTIDPGSTTFAPFISKRKISSTTYRADFGVGNPTTGNAAAMIRLTNSGGSTVHNLFYLHSSNASILYGSFQAGSDRRLKTDISYDFTKLNAVFDNLKPATYKLIKDAEGLLRIGFIAQDVQQAFSDAGYDPEEFGIVSQQEVEGDETFKDDALRTLAYDELIPILVAKVQSLSQEVAELKKAQ